MALSISFIPADFSRTYGALLLSLARDLSQIGDYQDNPESYQDPDIKITHGSNLEQRSDEEQA
jgi:hypothetical protein